MKIKRLLELHSQKQLNEKINVQAIQKEIDSIVTSLQGADKGLYNIATALQQNNMYEVRKDILTFISSINDMYEYLVVGLMTKINPPKEEPTEEKGK